MLAAMLISNHRAKSAVNAQLAHEKQQRTIGEIIQLAASNASLMELLNFSLDKIVAIMNLSAGTIHVFHRAKENLVLGSYKGLSARLARRMENIESGSTAIGRTARNKRLLIIRNMRTSPDYEYFGGKHEGFNFMVLIPIISEGENWGVISLFGKGHPSEDMLQPDLLEQFGEQLGSALVLGRHIRGMQSSFDNMKNLLGALGDELLSSIARPRNGANTARNVAWTLTRLFGGDRFDICQKIGNDWIDALSSEPDYDNQVLTQISEYKLDDDSANGIIAREERPPFKEFIVGRSYLYGTLPDENARIFIRLESGRKSSFELDLFNDVCKIIFGLHRRFKEMPVIEKIVQVEPDKRPIDNDLVKKADVLAQVTNELDRLIVEYADTSRSPELNDLLGWLKALRASSVQEPLMLDNPSELPRLEKRNSDSFNVIVSQVLKQLSAKRGEWPRILFDGANDIAPSGNSDEKIQESLLGFLSSALFKSGSKGLLRLTAGERNGAIYLELIGDKLSPLMNGTEEPDWLKEIGGKLEFNHRFNDSNMPVNCWRLVIPKKIAGPKNQIENPANIRILGVDGQAVIRELLTSMLTSLGYNSTVVGDSDAAIRIFKSGIESGNPYNIVIADYDLDKNAGFDLAATLKAINRDVHFILISGWGRELDIDAARRKGIDATLRKPFRLEQLSHLIESIEKISYS